MIIMVMMMMMNCFCDVVNQGNVFSLASSRQQCIYSHHLNSLKQFLISAFQGPIPDLGLKIWNLATSEIKNSETLEIFWKKKWKPDTHKGSAVLLS